MTLAGVVSTTGWLAALALGATRSVKTMDFNQLLPLLAAMRPGVVRYRSAGKTLAAAVGSGFAEAGPDRMAILKDGKLIQVGTPREILHSPADEYVDRFVQRRAAVV